MYSHFDEVPAGFQFVEHLDVTQEESECIAVEEDDEGEDDAAAKPTKGKRVGKKSDADADADDGESSASEQEEEAKEAEVEDDPMFARKRKDGKEKLVAKLAELDDLEVVEEEKAAPTAVVAVNGKKKGVKLEQLTDEQVEKGSVTNHRNHSTLSADTVNRCNSAHRLGLCLCVLCCLSAAAYQRIVSFLHSSGIARGEGLMTKSLSPLSQYLPDFRTDSWVKLKRDYIAGLSVGDNLDCVPIGGTSLDCTHTVRIHTLIARQRRKLTCLSDSVVGSFRVVGQRAQGRLVLARSARCVQL